MKIISYSDLHLEFGSAIKPPIEHSADVMILAGDIITLSDYRPLERFLEDWKKPALYVMGNHEYYTRTPMNEEEYRFKLWLFEKHPNVHVLLDDETSVGGVNFFGGTMWTNFAGGNLQAMETARQQMNDFRLIKTSSRGRLEPADTIVFHENFLDRLTAWFAKNLSGPRVVISHHAPVINPNAKYGTSPLMPAFNSQDMMDIIRKHEPDLWVYGHTHECDNQTIGKTRVISNQLGYPDKTGGYECSDFDAAGLLVDL